MQPIVSRPFTLYYGETTELGLQLWAGNNTLGPVPESLRPAAEQLLEQLITRSAESTTGVYKESLFFLCVTNLRTEKSSEFRILKMLNEPGVDQSYRFCESPRPCLGFAKGSESDGGLGEKL